MRACRFFFAAIAGAMLAASCGNGSSSSSSSTALVDEIPSGKQGKCATCHMPEFADGGRHHVGVAPACAVCHLETSWRPATPKHDWWPLDGAHATTDCLKCHVGTPIVLDGTPKKCIGCHREDYEKARDHDDKPTTCEDCHGTTKWKPAHEKKKSK